MRLISWNCNGAFRKKFHLLEPFSADICIVQECENPAESKSAPYAQWAGNHLWVGQNKNRGLAIFAQPDILLEEIPVEDHDVHSFILCRLPHDITLLAVWAKNSDTFSYIGQIYKYLQYHKQLLNTPKTLVIGDWNSNTQWDYKREDFRSHTGVTNEFKTIGIHSLYHMQTGEAQGSESQHTFFMYRKPEKPYHIDYALASSELANGARVEIEPASKWLEHSDHVPLLVKINTRGNAVSDVIERKAL